MSFTLKFWGTRGSISVSKEGYETFGGDTSCVSIETQQHLFIFDMGTGLRDLGLWLQEQDKKMVHIFVSHLHYDHVVGFPFFQAAWSPWMTLNIYAPRTENSGSIEHFFHETLMNPPLFPIAFKHMAATKNLHESKPGLLLDLNENERIRMEAFPLNHPGGAIGYKLTIDQHTVCYMSDHEHGDTLIDGNIRHVIKGADILIYDATYTPEEYLQKQGWGHSTYEEGIKLAKDSCVKKLFLFHHDPSHDDQTMQQIEDEAKKLWPHVEAARQGHILKVAEMFEHPENRQPHLTAD